MSQSRPFAGVFTALVTPMREAASGGASVPVPAIDEQALAALCEAQIAGGVDGLVACGTTGEAATMSAAEQARTIRIVVEAARGRVPVLAGVGSPSTAQSVELAQAAQAQGASGLLAVTPYYNRPSQDGLIAHFTELARLGQPIMLYNVPARTGCDLLPDTVARLCALPQVVALKEASGSVLRTQQLHSKLGDRLAILSGEDALNFPLYCVGACGAVSVVSNVAPALTAQVWDLFAAGQHQQARAAHERTLPLAELLFSEPNPIPAKAALALLGQLEPVLRLPLVPMTAAGRERLRAQLQALGLLA
ncbi:MAG TPA: 4-hydroxy-tetrahydrodipicolinate synthase [Pseudomonadota bacterium]|nr:4-hydroxy-tetrahydrodipicolinate synthase [Pseudomonadota bacterium]